jgi:hypothetical protein
MLLHDVPQACDDVLDGHFFRDPRPENQLIARASDVDLRLPSALSTPNSSDKPYEMITDEKCLLRGTPRSRSFITVVVPVVAYRGSCGEACARRAFTGNHGWILSPLCDGYYNILSKLAVQHGLPKNFASCALALVCRREGSRASSL